MVSEMLKYQNADGGFGNGFESDTLALESGATASAEAVSMVQDYGLDPSLAWVKMLLGYFEKTRQNTPSFWESVPKSIEDYPHPPWWSYKPDTDFTPNPCAVIASGLIRYGSDAQKELGREVAGKCIGFLNSDAFCWDHSTYCLQRLYITLRDTGSSLIDKKANESMKRRINANVCHDESKWSDYVAQPLDLAESPDSPWYPIVKEGIESNIDYWINNLSDEGYWPLHFSWGEAGMPKEVAQNWQGYFAVNRVRILKAFDAIDI